MRAVNEKGISTVVRSMKEIGVPFALIGGSALPYLLDPAYIHRPTNDVDVVVEVTTRMAYSNVERKLERAGFHHDMAGGPRCRWLLDDITVDVLPTSPNAAEFGSVWFEEAMSALESVTARDETEFHVIGPAHLLAAKLDAFFDRGVGDFQQSKDLEDIVSLVEGCSRLFPALEIGSVALRRHVSGRIQHILASPDFRGLLPGLIHQPAPPGAYERVLHKLSLISEMT
ncbi:MAG: hypothetical protein PHP44_13445 [Kiritimatiellae bacterium]|nr:hypothetical protein [Kiritimatiellia bacterium]